MGIVESIVRRYYHGSRRKLPVGTILTPQKEGYASDPGEEVKPVEDLLNQYRPEGVLSRQDSVFMVADPDLIDYAGGYIDFIYEVEPIGKVYQNDMYWYGELSVYAPYNPVDDELIQAAINYWNGTPGPREHNLTEYRAHSARIVRLAEDNT